MATNRFKIDRVKMALSVTVLGVLNSAYNRLQAVRYAKLARELPLADDPVFILGHWRTGTTLLHSLLSLDDRYATPSNFQCFTPGHFLLSECWLPKVMACPRQRPMDNMKFAWTEPQEDEFALCVRGLPSVYQNNAFPNHRRRHFEHLTLENVSAVELSKWKKTLMEFVSYLNYKHRRPLVLKSPPHTGRIRVLLDMFPNARFIHITRNPLEFIPSTIHLWRALDATNGFQQEPKEADYEDYVFECFRRIYGGFHRQKSAIPKHNYHEIRYEELVANPIDSLWRAYDAVRLGNFNKVAPVVDEFMQSKRNYKRNEHTLSPGLESAILEHCRDYMEQYGYAKPQRTLHAA